jgi:hypothetical protein
MQQYLTHSEKIATVTSKKIHCSVFLPFQVPKERLSFQKEHALMRKSFPKHYPIIQPSGATSNLTCRCNIQTWITNHNIC